MSLKSSTSTLLSAVFPGFIFNIVPIRIPSGKIVDLPPVSIVSPIFIGACLGISCN